MIGQTISHYKITGKLGEGGMGVVYKAEDTNLKRAVALKFLAAHLLGDGDIKARFRREAEAAAALNHPNICHVYEISEADGKTFIAMAFLEGEGLDKKIEAGPLKLNEALDIAHQIAEGLQEAHAHGIVHRDIKPANVMVTPKGGSKAQITIMDFGLAQLTEHSKLTRMDETMGTVAYMSPEQTMGADVDHRSDVWALGVVLYEMITGQRPFKGHYDKAVMYLITSEEPEPPTALRTGVPMELEWIIGKCLAKDSDSRYQTASDLAVDLKNLQEKLKSGRSTILRTGAATAPGVSGATNVGMPIQYSAAGMTVNPIETPPPDAMVVRRTRLRALQGLAAAFSLAFFGLLTVHFTETAPETPLRRFAFTPPVTVGEMDGNNFAVAVSPDGRHIAFVERSPSGSLWIQDLDQPNPRVIEGTEGAVSPFWSPGSDFIGFASGNEIKKVPVQGGLASRVGELPGAHFHGPSWSPDGEVIVFGSGNGGHGLYEVPARGGTPKQVIAPNEIDPSSGEPIGAIYGAHFLPREAGARVLAMSLHPSGTGAGASTMAVQNLETGWREFLGPGAFPFYSTSGHLVYQPSQTTSEIWALPFSLKTLRATGEAFPLAASSGHATVAADQTLVYLDSSAAGQQQLVWRNRAGEWLEAVGQPQPNISRPALSPDGQRAAVGSIESGNPDIWVHDLTRSTKTRLTFDDQTEAQPAWSPSGREIVYRHNASPNRIVSRAADGTGGPVTLVEREDGALIDPEWSHDARYLIYQASGKETASDIHYVQFETNNEHSEPQTFLSTPAAERAAKLSPDGRFLAYQSDESGRFEIYVRLFPGGDGKWQVSVNGGIAPCWRSDGRELYYIEASALMVASVSTESAFTLGQPQRLFDTPNLGPGYDVSSDGQRFLLVERAQNNGEEAAAPKIRVVQNWYEEFRNREQD